MYDTFLLPDQIATQLSQKGRDYCAEVTKLSIEFLRKYMRLSEQAATDIYKSFYKEYNAAMGSKLLALDIYFDENLQHPKALIVCCKNAFLPLVKNNLDLSFDLLPTKRELLDKYQDGSC
jgi:hypothetical protein